MVKTKVILLFLLLTVAFTGLARPHLFTEVKLNKNSAFVGEPVEVSVTIYTSTWFTEGVNPGNIKVERAFTVYFRSVSVSKQIDGKTYAGVTMIFNVFPYTNEDIEFPSVEFTVETPDEGGYKGVECKVKTKSRTIKVESIPKEFNNQSWLVATGVEISDKWTGNRRNVKVGDVLERRITQTVSGTVSGLVPPIVFDSIEGVSLYPGLATSEDIRSKTSVSAKRSDGVKYLFEKEGEITIPEIEITWWNARLKKLFKRTLKAETILVEPNPDLGMLSTIRDSLSMEVTAVENEGSDDGLFLGMSKKQWVILIVILLIVIILWKRILRWLNVFVDLKEYLKNRRIQYLNSEPYYFKKFMSVAAKNDRKKTINAMYQWIDKLNLPEPGIQFLAKLSGIEDFDIEVDRLQKQMTSNSSIVITRKLWTDARKKYLEAQKAQPDNEMELNP